jgi:hypothetical protein
LAESLKEGGWMSRTRVVRVNSEKPRAVESIAGKTILVVYDEYISTA